MQKRKSHTKSRRGCLSCKQKHIKCDEQGPPCANCVARSSTCTYPSSRARQARSSSQSTVSKPSISRDITPRLSPDSSGSSRMLELELMHRWSTRTYLGVCSIPQDYSLMQHDVPRKGLQYDCLLNGILALSALDMATTSEGTQSAIYHHAAMGYYDKCIRTFREDINNITRENHDSLYLLAVAIGIINVAALQFPRDDGDGSLPNVLSQIPVIFDLLRGSTLVAVRCYQWLMESIESIRIVTAMEAASPEVLDVETREVFSRLRSINDSLHEPAADGSDSLHDSYQSIINNLERCFAEEARGWIQGFLIAFPIFAGRKFTQAVRMSDPMALLILMYFAVLLEWHGKKSWWATSLGQRLAIEISDTLKRSRSISLPNFQEAMSWARQQVGLPALIEDVYPYRFEILEMSADGE